ncbi:MAG: YkgJ family cysteine cluster protein [Promethearchaeota archaeon]
MTSSEIKISKRFEKGVYFSCEMCGACCRGFDEGEVYIYEDDIIRLTKFLNMKNKFSLRKFARKYLKLVDNTFFWKEPGESRGKNYKFKTLGFKFTGEDEHCEFLGEDNKCTVHKARPFQCIAFPMGWNMLMNSITNFKDYSKKCPALRNSLENEGGHFYSREEIIRLATQEYEMEKRFFLKMKNYNFDIFKVYKFLPKDITC